MKRLFLNKKAVSTVEYAALLIILMLAFLGGRQYILRAFAGRWKTAADTFGSGLQYDPQKTRECVWEQDFNRWIKPQCFDERFKSTYASYVTTCRTNCSNVNINNWGSCDSSAPTPHNSPCCWLDVNTGTYTCGDLRCCDEACKTRCLGSARRSSVNSCRDSQCCSAAGDPACGPV